ncbi:dihydroorotase [Coprothermobacteraceae bacterium]|nr:dihydroorotase [Coprothermobacteraceae bacterium]
MILKNATALINRQLQKTDIKIDNGIISEIGQGLQGEKVVDVEGMIISPAFVDIHTHVRVGQEYKEDPAATIARAVSGGYFAINAMPNTVPPVTNAATVKYLQNLPAPEGFKVLVTGMMTQDNVLTEIEEMSAAGIVALSDDGRWTDNSFLFYQAIKYAMKNNLLVIDHAQDSTLFRSGRIYEGRASFHTGLKGFPKAAEAAAIYRDGMLNATVGAKLHITHVSTLSALETIGFLKQLGIHVTSDVTPHHLLFDESVYHTYDTNLKANPPFGDERDRKALIHSLRNGEIQAIATDHAPHSEPEKDQEWEDAPYGIASIDAVFSVLYTELVETRMIPLETLLTALSTAPAKLLKLDHGIEVGKEANLVLVRTGITETVTHVQGAKNNPYIGKEVHAKVEGTIIKGQIAYGHLQPAN